VIIATVDGGRSPRTLSLDWIGEGGAGGSVSAGPRLEMWARHNNGTFILRIDDTDQQRNVEAALAPIFRAFRWLGLNWDEGPEVGGPFGPYYQSQRTHLYQAAVDTCSMLAPE